MKKVIIILHHCAALCTILMLALAGCNLAQGPGAVKPPTHVALTGAKGLFLQTGTASKSMATARDVTNGQQLMKVNTDLSVGPATFTASDGSTVSVTITATRQVSAQYLLIAYSYSGGSQTAAVDMTTGAMAPLAQAPNYFAQVRMLGSIGYFTSGGTLYRADLSSGAETAMSPAVFPASAYTSAPGLSGSEYLHVTPAGDVYAYAGGNPPIGPWSPAWILFADGRTPVSFPDISGLVPVNQVTINGRTNVVEDRNTGDMWAIGNSGGTSVAKFVFNATNGSAGTPITISATPWGAGARLGEQAFYQGSIFVGNTTSFALASDGAGGLTVTQWDTSAVPQNDYYWNGQLLPGYWKWQTDGVSIYTAPCVDSQTINLVELPPGGGTATDPVLVNEAGITSFAVVGGQVLYTTASGTFQQATTVGATASLYSATPVSVTPVGQ